MSVDEAIILVGGKGTRLQAVVADRPKPMALVAGRPFLEWLLLALRRQGVKRAILATGHMGDRIRRHFQDIDLGLQVTCVQEESSLGTGGACRHALPSCSGATIAVLNGDSYCPFDLHNLVTVLDSEAAAALWLAHVDDASRFGSVSLDQLGRVTGFKEKAETSGPGWINAGVYLFRRTVLDRIAADSRVSMEREVLPEIVTQGNLRAAMGTGPFLDIGTPESFLAASDYLRQAFQTLREAA